MDYEERRRRHQAALRSQLGDHLERLEWPNERLAAERAERLRALVGVAKERSPWHGARLADVDVETFDEARLSEIPPMTKADLLAHFDEIVTDGRVTRAAVEAHLAGLKGDTYFLDEYHAVASGGSSGVRGVFVYGWEAWTMVFLAALRQVLRDRLADPELAGAPLRLGFVAAQDATHMTSASSQTFAGGGAEIGQFPVTRPLDDIVAGLNDMQPDQLGAYASMLPVLAAEAEAGRLTISPRRIVSTSEPLLSEIRSVTEETWGAPVANLWGTSEGGITAAGCFRGSGMHLADDLVIVEPVDEHGAPVAPGVRSAKVYLTNLFNPLLPLIRYELTDQVTVFDEPCPCGSAHRVIADIEGRLDDVFGYDDVVVHPHVFRTVLGRQSNVLEYQVRQTPVGASIAVRSAGPLPTGTIERELEAALRGLGVEAPRVTLEAVGELARQPSGKLKRFVHLPGTVDAAGTSASRVRMKPTTR